MAVPGISTRLVAREWDGRESESWTPASLDLCRKSAAVCAGGEILSEFKIRSSMNNWERLLPWCCCLTFESQVHSQSAYQLAFDFPSATRRRCPCWRWHSSRIVRLSLLSTLALNCALWNANLKCFPDLMDRRERLWSGRSCADAMRTRWADGTDFLRDSSGNRWLEWISTVPPSSLVQRFSSERSGNVIYF